MRKESSVEYPVEGGDKNGLGIANNNNTGCTLHYVFAGNLRSRIVMGSLQIHPLHYPRESRCQEKAKGKSNWDIAYPINYLALRGK